MEDVASIIQKATAMAGDPNFMAGVQFAREQAPDMVTGYAWALLPLVGGLQKSAGLDDDVALDQVLPEVIRVVLEIAQEGGDDEATPDKMGPIRDQVIDMLGRADAEAEMGEQRLAAEQEVMASRQPQQGALSSMMGGA